MPDEIEYPWFNEIESDKPLEQGDIILNCPVFIPQSPKTLQDDAIPGTIIIFDVIIMSHSCDLSENNIETVMVCPIFTLDAYSNVATKFKSKGERNNLIKGRHISLHILDKCNYGKYNGDHLIVVLKDIYGINFDFLNEFKKETDKRIRLLPPYREHLAQSFARFFMRIGLPSNIELF